MVSEIPRIGDFSTRMSAVSSPPDTLRLRMEYRTPSRSNAVRIPVRVGLMPTFLHSVLPFSAPSAIKYAAEEMSEGTQTSTAFKRLRFNSMRPSLQRMSAPMAASRRSV